MGCTCESRSPLNEIKPFYGLLVRSQHYFRKKKKKQQTPSLIWHLIAQGSM